MNVEHRWRRPMREGHCVGWVDVIQEYSMQYLVCEADQEL